MFILALSDQILNKMLLIKAFFTDSVFVCQSITGGQVGSVWYDFSSYNKDNLMEQQTIVRENHLPQSNSSSSILVKMTEKDKKVAKFKMGEKARNAFMVFDKDDSGALRD